jgi:hypothetical protein
LIQLPEAVTHSPAEIAAAWPTKVTSSRWAPGLDPDDAKAILGVLESGCMKRTVPVVANGGIGDHWALGRRVILA